MFQVDSTRLNVAYARALSLTIHALWSEHESRIVHRGRTDAIKSKLRLLGLLQETQVHIKSHTESCQSILQIICFFSLIK